MKWNAQILKVLDLVIYNAKTTEVNSSSFIFRAKVNSWKITLFPNPVSKMAITSFPLRRPTTASFCSAFKEEIFKSSSFSAIIASAKLTHWPVNDLSSAVNWPISYSIAGPTPLLGWRRIWKLQESAVRLFSSRPNPFSSIPPFWAFYVGINALWS